jgi:PAS domain S-box-containing protein
MSMSATGRPTDDHDTAAVVGDQNSHSHRPLDPPRVGRFSYVTADDRWEWSDAVCKMHGYQPGSVTPTTELVLMHKHPDDRPAAAELIQRVRRYHAPFSSRHRIIDKHAAVHVVVVVGDRYYNDEGEVIGTRGFYVDITDEFDADLQHSLDEAIAVVTKNRAVINQAIGIIMFTYGVSAQRAFDVLAWRSKDTNVKLRHIAAQFVADAGSGSFVPPSVRAHVDHLLLTTHQGVINGEL